MKEKFGFIYIWFDRKHKKYYIGSHYGTEDDGYVCSSRHMKYAYSKRPEDFKRRIIARVYSKSRKELLEEEYKWLSLIPNEELGAKYYNLRNCLSGHWFTDEEKQKSVKEKLSEAAKRQHADPEAKSRYEEGLKKRNNRSSDPEVREKRRQSMIATMAKKFPKEQRKSKEPSGRVLSEKQKQSLAEGRKKRWLNNNEQTST